VVVDAGFSALLNRLDLVPCDVSKLGMAHQTLYIAPEVLSGGPHSVAADVYSFGILLAELDTGESVYHFLNRTARCIPGRHDMTVSQLLPLRQALTFNRGSLQPAIVMCLQDDPRSLKILRMSRRAVRLHGTAAAPAIASSVRQNPTPRTSMLLGAAASIFLLASTSTVIHARSQESTLAVKAEELYNSPSYDRRKLLQFLQRGVGEHPQDVGLQWRLARAAYDVASLPSTSLVEKKTLIYLALDVIQAALALDADNFAVHKWYAEALAYFLQADAISPGFWKKNSLLVAQTYLKLNDVPQAKDWLRLTLAVPVVTSEDQQVHDQATATLATLK
ncbi:hypothetical protein DYB28_010683, partial [Aphanomyces astaci]